MNASATNTSIQSMTGFGSGELEIAGSRLKIELRALNHRFLDLKVKLPREYSAAEMPLRGLLQKHFSRGTIDLRIDRIQAEGQSASTGVTLNLPLALQYRDALAQLQKSIGSTTAPTPHEIAQFPDVFSRGLPEVPAEEAWKRIEPLVQQGIARLSEMRAHEGAALTAVLKTGIENLRDRLGRIENRRLECQKGLADRTRERINQIFQAYPLPEGQAAAQTVLESRIAQELALLLDRTDVAEEIHRFRGHLDHVIKTLNEGGLVGKKLEFLLQELGREMNTLGNKAQDLGVADEVVQSKVVLEQLREQILNLA